MVKGATALPGDPCSVSRMRQEDYKFEASLGYRMRVTLSQQAKEQTNEKKQANQQKKQNTSTIARVHHLTISLHTAHLLEYEAW